MKFLLMIFVMRAPLIIQRTIDAHRVVEVSLDGNFSNPQQNSATFNSTTEYEINYGNIKLSVIENRKVDLQKDLDEVDNDGYVVLKSRHKHHGAYWRRRQNHHRHARHSFMIVYKTGVKKNEYQTGNRLSRHLLSPAFLLKSPGSPMPAGFKESQDSQGSMGNSTLPVKPYIDYFTQLTKCATNKCRKYISQLSCQSKCGTSDPDFSPCSCHPNCVIHNRCCEDFQALCPTQYQEAIGIIAHYPKAQPLCDEFTNHLLISHCPVNASAEEHEMCSHPKMDSIDIASTVPVRDLHTSWHFKNQFCWDCWKMPDNAISKPWKFKLNMPDTFDNGNITISDVLSLVLTNPDRITWIEKAGFPSYKCPIEDSDYPSNCTKLDLWHPDLGAECWAELESENNLNVPVLESMSCEGRCDDIAAFPCSCRSDCVLHETCCKDFIDLCHDSNSGVDNDILRRPGMMVKCDEHFRVPLISRCPESAPSQQKEQCDWRDPFNPKSMTPVTDSVSHLQFKNKFCWLCWEMPGHVIQWSALANEHRIGYDPLTASIANILVYMLENHQFTHWFPMSRDVPRHSCSSMSSESRKVSCMFRIMHKLPKPDYCNDDEYTVTTGSSVNKCLECNHGATTPKDNNIVLTDLFSVSKIIDKSLALSNRSRVNCSLCEEPLNKSKMSGNNSDGNMDDHYTSSLDEPHFTLSDELNVTIQASLCKLYCRDQGENKMEEVGGGTERVYFEESDNQTETSKDDIIPVPMSIITSYTTGTHGIINIGNIQDSTLSQNIENAPGSPLSNISQGTRLAITSVFNNVLTFLATVMPFHLLVFSSFVIQ